MFIGAGLSAVCLFLLHVIASMPTAADRDAQRKGQKFVKGGFRAR
jgi:hypothetical protein